MYDSDFTPAERALFRQLNNPERIQQFFETLNRAKGKASDKKKSPLTCRSPRRVIRDRSANCVEGAMFGAAALRLIGHPPLLLDLESVRDDDHVIAVFRQRGHWGAISNSAYSGLGYREPVYRTLRELVMTYFEHYFNKQREKTLRKYSRPVNLARFDSLRWMTAEEDLWEVVYRLCDIHHTSILLAPQVRGLSRVDQRTVAADRAACAAVQEGSMTPVRTTRKRS